MKNLVWLVALPAMGGALFSKWLNFPLTRQLRGGQFPLLTYAPDAVHFHALSFGLIAALLCALGAFAFVFGKHRALSLAGAALVWLAVFAIVKVAALDAPLLATLASELDQQQSATTFAQAALPLNAGEPPSLWPRVPLDTIGDRLLAGFYFARFGCWLTLLLGGVALAIGTQGGRHLRIVWATAGGLGIIIVAGVTGPILSHLLIERGQLAEARGAPDTAIALYRRALALDGWAARQLTLYERIGSIDTRCGRSHTIEAGIHHAGLPSTQIDPAKSIAELTALSRRASEPLAGVLRRRAADLLAQQARSLHASAAYSGAIAASRAALRLDPAAILPAYYLSREYYLIGAYRDSLEITELTLARVDDPIVRANLFANLGDAQTRLGAFQEAKLAYRRSYRIDYLRNLRALSALNGP